MAREFSSKEFRAWYWVLYTLGTASLLFAQVVAGSDTVMLTQLLCGPILFLFIVTHHLYGELRRLAARMESPAPLTAEQKALSTTLVQGE